MNVFKKIQLFAAEKPLLAGTLSVVAIAVPYLILMALATCFISNGIAHAVVMGVIMLFYIVTYILFTKFINKLK